MRGSPTGHSVLGTGARRLALCVIALLLLLAGLPLHFGPPAAYAQPSSPQPGAYVTNGTVNAVVTTGSVTYIGGSFTQVGPVGGPMQARNNIAALDADGVLTAWNPAANGTVNALLVSGGTLYAGGAFTNIGGAARNRLAAISAATGAATGWNPNANNTVYCMGISGNTLFCGGDFTNVGGNGRNRLAGIDLTSGSATGLNPNINNTVHALTITGSTIYIGGDFTRIGGLFGNARNRIAAINTGGGVNAWNPNANNTVFSLALSDDATVIYAGGTFTNIGGAGRNRIAALNAANNNATAWNPNSSGQVTALATSGTYIYAGGTFATIGGAARNNLACLKADATATSWNPNANGAVNAIAASGNTYWAGGAFATVGGSSRQSVAKFGPVKLGWSAATASGSETTSPVNLTVTATEANSLDMTVNYAVTGGSATGGGVDYTLAGGIATLAAGTTSVNIPVTIVSDLTDEPNETIVVSLSGPVNAELGATVTETYTILDDDTAGVAVSPSGGSTDVIEAGAGDSYTLALTSQPTADVNITVSPDAQVTANPASLSFTPANWNVPQTVNVSAVDDLVAEGPHTGTISHSSSSADLYYNGLGIAPVAANVADNDTASVVVTQSGGSTAVAEGGAGDTYSVVLTSRPTADVSISLNTGTQLTANPPSLLFTTANWNVVQTVNVSAADDWVAEGPHTGTISHAASSTDAFYNGIAIAPVTVDIADNDTAGVTVAQTGGSTDVTEGGAGDVYTVVLTSQPLADVTISISPDAQLTADFAVITFTSANWNVPQWVTVTAVDDAVAEGSHTSTLMHSAASADPVYAGMAIASVTANVTDNDTAGVIVTQSGGSTAVAEGGATDTYTMVLRSQPTSDVIVSVSPDAQVGAGPAALTFTPGNWNAAQTVTVSASDDWVAEGNHAGTITHSAASADGNYNGAAIAPVNVNISDNDTAGVTVSPSGGSTDVAEGGVSDTYTVALTSQPTSDVTVTLHCDAQVSADSAVITFTAADWATARTVTVSAVDDAVAEGSHTGCVTHTAASADGSYNGIAVGSVTANIADNDTAGVVVIESDGSTGVTEGGSTDTYTVVLTSRPINTVIISVSGDAQAAPDTANLVFTPGNWNVPQTVTVSAVDDAVAEGNHTGTITHHASSTDPAYLDFPVASVTVQITDNDAAGIVVTESGGSTQVTEGGSTDTYTVVLSSRPTSDVTVSLSPDAQVGASVASLVFTAGSWNIAQTVTVTAVDDHVVEGAHSGTITASVASADPNYGGANVAAVTAAITDNDSIGVTISQTGGSTDAAEGGSTDVYTVVLSSQPTADVTVSVSPDAQVGANPSSLLFTPANWGTVQLVTVTATDDAVAEGNHTGTISHSSSSADANYNGIAVDAVTVHITDNDAAGVTVIQSGGSTDIVEGGASDSYTVVLTSRPTSDVTIAASCDAQVGAVPGSLTFTAANWNVAQTVTVSAVDDLVAEGAHNGTISHSAASADANYAGIAVAGVTVHVTDNDSAGVAIVQSDGSTLLSEAGTSDTYTVALTSQPTAGVTVTLHPDAQLGASPATLTFTAVDWNVSQAVTVSAVDDWVDEGSHGGTISHTVASADATYQGMTISSLVATITDNDTAGVNVTESGGSTDVTEGGATDTYSVILDSQPSSDVVVHVAGGAQVSAGPSSLTFTAANWGTAQTVTVTAMDDAVQEGPHTGALSHSATSSDAKYSGLAIAGITAHITDNDSAGVSIVQSGGSTGVAEGGAGDTYTIVLNSRPTADVGISLSCGPQVGITPNLLTFTTGNWNTPQTVNVSAVDDSVAEGLHDATVTHAAASADPNYNGISTDNVAVQITDNDTAGVSLIQTGGSTDVTEGGAGDVYTVVLISQPLADVSITVDPGTQVAANPAGLTFTPGNWNTGQLVTVSAVDDWVAEGAHTGTIAHSTASTDAAYNGISVVSLTAHVTDNDTAGVTVSQSGGSTAVSESGLTDTYTVVLTSQPTATVIISVSGDSQVSAAPSSLAFTTANWNTAQTVTVSAVDDWVAEGNHTGNLSHAAVSTDPKYNGVGVAPVNVNISDNDTVGVFVSPSGGSTDVAEGGTDDTYTVVLNSQPMADVTITLHPDAQLSADAGTLLFTASDWNATRTVTVSAADDRVDEGPHSGTVSHTAASSDAAYHGLSINSITASIADNDTAGVSVTESGSSTDVAEGGLTDGYSVVLNSQPAANVVIAVSAGPQVNASPASLTFTPANWETPQAVIVTAVDDAVAEGPHDGTLSHTATSTDAAYMGIAVPGVTAHVTDNDAAGVVVTQSGGSTDVAEGGVADTYTIVLNSQPTANVNVSVSPDAQLSVNPASLTFTPGSWDLTQTVTVTAADDPVMEGPHTGTITHSAASADANYAGIATGDVTANITDNDSAGVVVSESSGSTHVTEGGATDSYTLVLSTAPASDVVVTITGDAQVDASPDTLSFTPGNWSLPQAVTVSAVDDYVAEGNHTGTVTHGAASADPLYNGISVTPVTAEVADNDVAGISLTQSGGSTDVAEGGASDTYTLALTSQPTSDVTVNVSGSATVGTDVSSVTFTPANWDTAQAVTVSAVDDWVAEGNHTGIIAHTASSADPLYNGLAAGSVTAHITDNDVAGVTITPSGGSTNLTEGGATDTYTVVLASQPTGTVPISVSGDSQVNAAPANLTFTTGNWDTPQTVTLTAVDDSLVEGPHSGTVSHHATSTDPNYLNIPVVSVAALITDNDTSGVSITESGGSTDVTEGGATDTYDIVLTCQPSAEVTVNLSPAAGVSVNPASIVFNAGNWNTPRSVTVTAVDDGMAEGTHSGSIAHSAVSADPGYNGIPIVPVNVSIADNDTAAVSISESDGSTDVAEGGMTDAYTLVLTSQPASDVTVTLGPDAQVGVNPGTVIFTPANWDQARAVAVWAVDDWVVEGSHAGVINGTAVSADPAYNGIPVAAVTIQVADNDAAGITIDEAGGSTRVTEGGAGDTYTIVLTSQPTGQVDISLTGDAQMAAAPGTLSFTPANWNVAQVVTVTAVNDWVAEGDHTGTVSHVVASTDPNYAGFPIADLLVQVADNDSAGVLVAQSGGSTDAAEGGGADTYTVVLLSQPLAAVAVSISGDAQASADPATLSFDAANWNVPQSITVSAVDDQVAEGNHTGTLTQSVTSGDPLYEGYSLAPITVHITDNDTAGVTVTQSSGSTNVAEGGVSDDYSVVLTSQPLADVTLSATVDSQVVASPSSVVFTAGNWNVPQSVTVSAVDDAVAEGGHTGSIAHAAASADPAYSGIAIGSVTAGIADNDAAGIVVTESGGSTSAAEGGSSDTYTIVLTSEPTAPVAVNVAGDLQVTAAPDGVSFNAANWSVPQTITISAVDDDAAEGNHTGCVSHSVVSSDVAYDGMTIPPVTVTVSDNDTAGVTLTQTGGSTLAGEAGATDVYTIRLTSRPAAAVTVTPHPDSQLSVDPAAVIFTTANWNMPQLITVSALDDRVAEGNHTGSITHSAASADTNYEGITVASVTVDITDNDTAGVTVSPSGGSTDVSEGGSSDTYTISLASQPTSDVTISVISDSQLSANPAVLNFTPGDWNVPQSVTVSAADDEVAEGGHTGNVSHTAVSTDPAYNGIAISGVTAHIADNDVAGVAITQSGGSTDVAEAGAGDSYEVVLTSRPTSNVTISVSATPQVAAAPSSLTFTAANWNVPQTVVATAVDDAVAEGPHGGNISHTVTSADAAYNGIGAASVTVNVADNDTAGVTVTVSGLSTDVAEGGSSDTYTLVLTSQPVATVVISISCDSQVTTVPASLAFTPGNWNIPQTVTVSAVDDSVAEGNHAGAIGHSASSTDPNYNGISVSGIGASIDDNDAAGVIVSESGGNTNVAEGGADDTYTVVLTSQPLSDATVSVSASAQLGTTPQTLAFTPSNWNTPQTVTVSAVDDRVAEGNHTGTVAHTATSSDAAYNGIAVAGVAADINDDDVVGVAINQSGGSTAVAEGGSTDAYLVSLSSQPLADVIVSIAADAQVGVNPASLTFTPGDWNQAQAVAVWAVDDPVAEGPHAGGITHTAASADPAYDGIAAAGVAVDITDNDTAGVTVTETVGSTQVAEGGGADTYTMVLNSQPLADVTIAVAPDAQLTANPGVITFTPANWSVPQTLTISAVDDWVAEGSHTGAINHSATSTDTNYQGITVAGVTAGITDNDTAGVVVSESDGSSNVAEGGGADTYTMVLNSQPLADVTIAVAPDAQLTANPGVITFTPANWSVPQTLTISAVDDWVAEGSHTGAINHSATSTDANYQGITVAGVTAGITDNDTAGVVVSESDGSSNVAESDGADTYTMVLNSQPLADVTVSVNASAQISATPVSLTFTAGDWNVPQTVTVSATDDRVAEGNHLGTIAHTAASPDAAYDGITVAGVTAAITDNDTAGVTVSPSDGIVNVAEGGAGDQYTVVLDSEPTADVVIAVSSSAEVTANTASLTFTPANWDTAQSVTVDAVDDRVAEGNHTGSLSHTASSADANYQGIAIPGISAGISDNDTAGVVIEETGGSTEVAEGGATDTYSVVLNSQPLAGVTIAIAADVQLTVDPALLSFSAGNWDVPQTVTVTAVDDSVAEGLHVSSLSHTASSTDAGYDGIAVSGVDVVLSDEDTAGIVVVEGDGVNVAEGGAGDSYEVTLTSQPLADVIVGISTDAQVSAAPASLTFTPADWSLPQAVTVTAFDDSIAEGNHTGTSNHSAASSDILYAGMTVASVTASVSDNDTAGIIITETGTTDVAEGGATDTFTAVLTSQPTADVTLSLGCDTQVAASPVSLSFTGADWYVPQVVTVSAVDDWVAEGDHSGVITPASASADAAYDGIGLTPVTVHIADNDAVGVAVSESGGATGVTEGGAEDSYIVVLTSQPLADVNVSISCDAQVSVNPASLSFNSANWNEPRTVSVFAVDDPVAEGNHTGTIIHSATSEDPVYDGAAISDVTVQVTDNDAAGVLVAESGASTDVVEGGAGDGYTVALTSQPAAEVTVSVSCDAQVTSSPAEVTFTASDWNVPQAVTVSAVDDAVYEGPHTGSLAHTAASDDPLYDSISIAGVTAQVADNDGPGILVVETGGSTQVTEGGGGDDYSLTLTSQPTADVTVTVSYGAGIEAGPASATFTPGNWNVPQSVSVSAVDDWVAEGTHGAGISHAAASADASYDGIFVRGISVGIIDNDTAGVIVDAGDGLQTAEGGESDTYSLSLHSQPLADVTVSLSPDAQVTATPTTFNFTAADWNVPQTVAVSAVDDASSEGPHSGSIAQAASSADPAYSGIAVATAVASIADNDAPGVLVTESDGCTQVTEGGSSDTYTVVLASRPGAPVVIGVNHDGAVTASAASLTFTAADWNIPQVVTVTAVDDHVAEGAHTGSTTHTATSGDPAYSGIAVAGITATINDNETAGVAIDQGPGTTWITEGSSPATYTVYLTSQPLAPVAVTVAADAQVTANPATLHFTASNWNVPQTVTYAAVDDQVAEGPHQGIVAHSATSADPAYDGLGIGTAAASIIDNDAAGVNLSETVGSTDVAEGGAQDIYIVTLTSEPAADVVLSPAPGVQVAISPASLTFTAANWNVPQTVTVTAVDDWVAEGAHAGTVFHSVTSTDPFYAGIAAAGVTVHIGDNDTAGVIISDAGHSVDVSEGGATGTYTVRLASQPLADVSISLTPSAEVTVDTSSLVFTPADWNTAQAVTVTAVDDRVVEGPHTGIVEHTATSSDAAYGGIAVSDETCHVADNDAAGVTVSPSGGSLDLAEGGATDTYTVVLTSQPAANVVLKVYCSPQVTAVPTAIAFTPADWNEARTVTVTAVDDTVAEGDHTGSLSHTVSSADPFYNGLGANGLTASIADNDTPGIVLTETGGSTQVIEGGPPDTYTLALRTRPAASVQIAVVPESRLAADYTTLVFTPANWNVPQIVTVSASDDGVVEDTIIRLIHHSVQSLDDGYNNLSAPTVAVRLLDNDIAPASCFYFAEGYTGPGFQEYLSIGNPNSYAVTATVTFMFVDGSSEAQDYDIPACARASVDVNATVGAGREVSIKVTSASTGLVAERPMYFLYQGTWTGGHDVVGASAPSTQWYFAEGYTGPGFEEWICVLNPSDAPAHLTFRFQTEEQGEIVRTGSVVGAHARSTFMVNNLLGAGFQTSLKLESDQPVVAERPMYFEYGGMGGNHWAGGHCVMGTPDLATQFGFAEGCTRGGFEEWLTLQNPNDAPVTITAVYQLGQGQGEPVSKQYKVAKGKRFTVYVPNEVGYGKDVSVQLTCDQPFLAERPMYFDYTAYGANWQGGHCVIGSVAQSREWFFAEGYTGTDFHEWLCLQNPGTSSATVLITYYTQEIGQLPVRTVVVPAKTRMTVMVNENAGPNFQLSCRLNVLSGPGIIVERPMYFSYNGWDGGHDVVGYIP